MSLHDILKYSYLPLRIQNGDVKSSLKLNLNNYYEKLVSQRSLHHQTPKLLIAIKPVLVKRVLKLLEGINSSINNFTIENPDRSYITFSQAMTESISFSYLRQMPGEVRKIDKGVSFYRVRPLNEENETIGVKDRNELFHIPFDKPDLVTNGRYSLEREPALYLSSSVLLALLERRLENIPYVVSRFEVREEILIINVDFSYYLPFRYEKVVEEKPGLLEFLGITWPLIAACSIKVHPKNESDELNEEYIIPQLLMKYVQEHRAEYQGIRYYSTRINLGDPDQHQDQYNLVLPTKKTAFSGYDENLKKLFRMTDIVNVKDGESPQQVEQKLKQMQAYDIDF